MGNFVLNHLRDCLLGRESDPSHLEMTRKASRFSAGSSSISCCRDRSAGRFHRQKAHAAGCG
jgi:hypothetical protein